MTRNLQHFFIPTLLLLVTLLLATTAAQANNQSVTNDLQDDLTKSREAEQGNKGLLFDFLFADRDCNCRCGIPNRQARLLGGEFLRTYEFPWLALVQVRQLSTITAALINDRYVLTSTSPLVGLTPFDVKVTLGQFDRCFPDTTSQNLSVSSILLHPDFSPGNRAHDIALIRLSSPAKFDKRIRPICLSFPAYSYLGQVATVVGWAENSVLQPIADQSATCRPRKVGLPVLSSEDCASTAFDPQFVSNDKGCLGVIGTRSVICASDSGGPVMYRTYGGSYQIIGVLSDRNNCTETPSTALYTRVNDHLEWIKSNTKDACYCVTNDLF